jgi:hypothetical protein
MPEGTDCKSTTATERETTNKKRETSLRQGFGWKSMVKEMLIRIIIEII